MSDDLREAVARALYLAIYPKGSSWENWSAHVEKHGGYDGREGSRKLADAAISAARPVIERETREACAELALDTQNADYARAYNEACDTIAAAIRSQP